MKFAVVASTIRRTSDKYRSRNQEGAYKHLHNGYRVHDWLLRNHTWDSLCWNRCNLLTALNLRRLGNENWRRFLLRGI